MKPSRRLFGAPGEEGQVKKLRAGLEDGGCFPSLFLEPPHRISIFQTERLGVTMRLHRDVVGIPGCCRCGAMQRVGGRIFVHFMTSDRKLKASREGSK